MDRLYIRLDTYKGRIREVEYELEVIISNWSTEMGNMKQKLYDS